MGALAALAGGCGPDPCSRGASETGTAPVLKDFSLSHQLEEDPWMVVFAADFLDADGDLGAGSVVFYLDGRWAEADAPMFDLLRQAGLPMDATSGVFGLPLRFGESVSDGAEVLLGVQLRDGAGQRSNCYSQTLSFDVSSL